MKYILNITSKAKQDIKDAADYIEFSLLNPEAALNLLENIKKRISLLSINPHIHSLVDDDILKLWGIRFISIDNYIAFYTISDENKTVNIIRFLYKKRDWINILKNVR